MTVAGAARRRARRHRRPQTSPRRVEAAAASFNWNKLNGSLKCDVFKDEPRPSCRILCPAMSLAAAAVVIPVAVPEFDSQMNQWRLDLICSFFCFTFLF